MANTLGNPTVENDLREDIVGVVNTNLNEGGGANAILRLRNSTTTLVDFPLDATNPLTLGTDDDGEAVFNPVNATETAVAGTATIPDNYQVLDKAGVVRLSGTVTATDGISTGQDVSLGTVTIQMPAS